MNEPVNISSVIVHPAPGGEATAREGLAGLPGVEVGATGEDGRMVVIIEAPDDAETTRIFETIRLLPGVLSVAMVYHRYESNPDEEA